MVIDHPYADRFTPIPGGDGPHAFTWYVPDDEGRVYHMKPELDPGDDPFGIEEYHVAPDGKGCGGRIQWRSFWIMEASGHRLIQRDPLHIEASIGCRRCPMHGWIHNGRWVDG